MVRIRMLWVLAALAVGSAGLLNLGGGRDAEERPAPERSLTLATTTSVQDSGLLDELLPEFQRRSGVYVRVKAVGSGKALELARIGEADVVLTHSPALEEAFVRAGHAESRLPVARNAYLIVGPAADPAGVRGAASGADALQRIAEFGSPFISRGDESGTHRKELDLWAAAGIQPGGAWYEQFDGGMGAVLRRADERRAYTLTDGATFAAYRRRLNLEALHQGTADLDNPYSVMAVAGGPRMADARRFVDFLTGPEGQGLIAGYGAREYGRSLFEPATPPR
jgi:tungstate transport system substrate-binding protein